MAQCGGILLPCTNLGELHALALDMQLNSMLLIHVQAGSQAD
ncbi:hypothetical protein ABDD95_13965 [Mucilaginibacter sp. PAMB04274]